VDVPGGPTDRNTALKALENAITASGTGFHKADYDKVAAKLTGQNVATINAAKQIFDQAKSA